MKAKQRTKKGKPKHKWTKELKKEKKTITKNEHYQITP